MRYSRKRRSTNYGRKRKSASRRRRSTSRRRKSARSTACRAGRIGFRM